MISPRGVYFWFNLWLFSSSLSPQTSSLVSQTFPNKASDPRVSPALSVRRKTRGARLRLRESNGGSGTSQHEASIWSTFLVCLKTVYQPIRFSTLLSSYKAMACCLHGDFHRATVKAQRTWLRSERFKSQTSSRMSVSRCWLRVKRHRTGSNASNDQNCA